MPNPNMTVLSDDLRRAQAELAAQSRPTTPAMVGIEAQRPAIPSTSEGNSKLPEGGA